MLRPMDNFRNMDAVLDLSDPDNPKEPEWPAVEFIVGNPPFLGDKLMRRELGDEYVDKLRALYADRIPGQSDFVCYWFEKARKQIEDGKCKRAGFLATQGIRGGANREVLKRIKETGDIFFAESDRPWVLNGANVHVSMVGFDDASETKKVLDNRNVEAIASNLSSVADITTSRKLDANTGLSFIGAAIHGPFDIPEETAISFLKTPTPTGRPVSDVVRPWINGLTITKRQNRLWIMAHDRLDEAVFAAYGWDAFISDEEILDRLLKLNLA